MIADKIGIVLEKTKHNKYNLQVVGIDADKITSNISELEQTDIGFATVTRTLERLLHVIKMRLNRGQIEFREKDNGSESDEVSRNR